MKRCITAAIRTAACTLGLTSLIQLPCDAADKNGVGPNAISLPSGPGSIEGLGESFQPLLNTGTAKYRLPLRVPPGTAGHSPQLALEYNGGSGNGPLGYGWSISTACVQRRTDEGIPLYADEVPSALSGILGRQDQFINDAREELVPTAGGFYFCRNEGAFIRYRQNAGSWEATDPHGVRLSFGATAGGRIGDGSGNRTFAWLIERVTETHGNTILYRWRSFGGETNLNQKYLEEISYGPGAPPWTNLHFVRFEYEDRADWFEDNRAGFPVRTGKRLKRIWIGTQGPTLDGHVSGDFNQDGVGDHLVRRYDLDYRSFTIGETQWSLLARVQLVGADGVTALPPATFEYRVAETPALISAAPAMFGSVNDPPVVMDRPNVDLLDANADGLPDILRTDPAGGPHQVYLNRGMTNVNGQNSMLWSAPVELGGDVRAWNVDLQSQANIAHLSDMNGDGLADLVYRSTVGDVYYFGNDRMSWATRRLMSIEDTAPPSPFADANVRTADLDFDKRMDVIQSVSTGGGADYRIWFNLGNGRYSRSVTVLQENGWMLSAPGTHVAELNGDRVPDIARVRAFGVEVTAGLGYGSFSAPARVSLPDLLLTSEQAAQAKLTDINGDGLDDLVLERPAPGRLWFWLNQGNYSFGRQVEVINMPSTIGVNTAVRWADVNGNGSVDVIYADSSAAPRLRAVDVGLLLGTAGGANILIRIANGIGRVTQIDYESSSTFALRDAAAGRPWPDPMPFPVGVVSSVTTSDSLGHEYVTRFQYHDGYYAPEEKQFRGFARAEQIDIGDETAPTLITHSHFDTGRNFEAMKGKLFRLTTETEDGRVFGDDFTSWVLPPRVLLTGTNGQSVNYAHPTGSTNIIKELGQGAERRLESEMAYDRFGNQTLDADYGIVENGNRSAFDDERIIVTQFAINTNAWILRAPAAQEIRDENGAVISRTDHYYDDETFSGNNLGLVTIGNLTMKQEWIDPTSPTAFVKSARTKFDTYGNPTAVLDPLAVPSGGAIDFSKGHLREFAYDNRFHTYPVSETIHVGNGSTPLVFQATYDESLGTVTSSFDFNTNQTVYGYDPFARLASIVKPGDTLSYPTVEYEYALAVPVGGGGIVNHVETRQLDRTPGMAASRREHYFVSRQFVDGLGRELFTKTEAEPATGSTAARVVVMEAVQFNARQKPARVLNPHFTILNGPLDQLLAFEDVGSPGWQGQFHHEGNLVALSFSAAHATRTEYDATLREIRKINPDSTVRRMVFEPLLSRTFDENDSEASSPHFNTPMVRYTDGLSRLVQVDEVTRLNDDGTPAGTLRAWNTRFEYDLNDQLIRITDSQNNVKAFDYDGLKRKTFLNDPDRGIMRWLYDDASNLKESFDAKGQRIVYTYDGANRILTEKYHDGLSLPTWRSISRSSEALTNSVVYHYDTPCPDLPQGDHTTATARNVKGLLAWVEDLSGEEHFSYDARSRTEWVVKRSPDPALRSHGALALQLISYKTAFDYDSSDRLTRVVYPDNDAMGYRYNERSLIHQITGGVNSLTQDGSVIRHIRYHPSNQQAEIGYGNSVQTGYEYDSRLRLNRLVTFHGSSGEELLHFSYDFDGISNIKTIQDERPGSAFPEGDPRRNTQLLQYDDLYRLRRTQYSFELPGQPVRDDGVIHYRYDRIGNMLAQTSTLEQEEDGLPVTNVGEMDSGGTAGPWDRDGREIGDPPGPHALTSIRKPGLGPQSFSYDANGNMLVLDALTNTWDFKDRLVAVENSRMRAEYTYDYADRRITKRVAPKTGSTNRLSSVTVTYVNKYFEIHEHDAPTKYVWNANTRVARVTGSLSPNPRVQRFRLWPGWNLISLAVGGAQLPSIPEIAKVYQWHPTLESWNPVTAGASLDAGTVLWLSANASAAFAVTGSYADPTNRFVTGGGSFIPGPGLEAWHLGSAISNLSSESAWLFSPARSRWLSHLSPQLGYQSELPEVVAPGETLFVRTHAPAELLTPQTASRIFYYFEDHLGSSTATGDALGMMVQNHTYHPFGSIRTKTSTADHTDPYNFIQKEEDAESGLHYFDSRHLATRHGRFCSTDILTSRGPGRDMKSYLDLVSRPQQMNPYSYAGNCPLTKRDPTGLAPETPGIGGVFDRLVIDSLEIALAEDNPRAIMSALEDSVKHEARLQSHAYTAFDAAGGSRKMKQLVGFEAPEDVPLNSEIRELQKTALNVLGRKSLTAAANAAQAAQEMGFDEFRMSGLNQRVFDIVSRRTVGISQLLAATEQTLYELHWDFPRKNQTFFSGRGKPFGVGSGEEGMKLLEENAYKTYFKIPAK